ncbi:MAG: AhpC/TSA family protein [Anaerolineales bacterium]
MQVHRFHKEYEARGANILVVGFEKEERAPDWMRRAQVKFPFLIDVDRAVYRAYGVERSILQSWNPRILWFYFKRLLRGKGVPIFRADPTQLGGDILIDREGRIRWIYPSNDAMDRPSVDQLLAAIDNIQ